MKEPRHDDERLAALLDGTLSEQQRQELLAELAASGDDYEVMVDTAALLQDIEDEDVPAGEEVPPDGVVPFRRRSRPAWQTPAKWGALAAGIGGIALIATLAGRGRATADPLQLAERLEHGQQGLPQDWIGQTPWSPSRGDDPSAVDARQAVQAGAMLMDLAVAVRARDSADTQIRAGQLHSRFDAEARSASPFYQIGERAGESAASLRPLLSRGTERLERRLDRESVELGVWLQAARLAAHSGDEEFFREDETRKMLSTAERFAEGDVPAQRALTRARSMLPPNGPSAWSDLHLALTELLTELASE